jgi:CHAT domain-containing protein
MTDPREPTSPSGTPADTADRDSADPELQADLRRLGLQGRLAAMILKREATEVIRFASPVTLLPMAYLASAITRGSFGEEAAGLGLRETVRLLRPHGQSLLLGESLLSLARAVRMVEPLETRLEWILEALTIFRALHAERRLGRAYIDLAVNLKDGRSYYDALHALGEGEKACAQAGDAGAGAAARYHRAHIYRMLGQPIEALHELERAAAMLPNSSAADSWRSQIRSERVFNHFMLERFDDALKDLEAWIASGDDHYFPFFYRGEVFERRGELERALADYGEAAVRLAGEVLRSRSERFRRRTSLNTRHVFERGVRLALALNDAPMAVSLLELLNTGGRAVQPTEIPNASPPREELAREEMARLTSQAAALRQDAAAAVSRAASRELDECQERADLLLAERDVIGTDDIDKLGDADAPAQEKVSLRLIRRRIDELLPNDAVLLEYTIVSNEVWVIAVTHERTVLHKSELGAFELEMLKRSAKYEFDGLLRPVALDVLEKALLAPVESQLRDKKRVVIALADAAYGIPFHAMRWAAGVLIDSHDVQYVVGGVTVRTGTRAPTTDASAGLRCRFLGTPKVEYADVEALTGVESECSVVEDLVNAEQRRLDLPATSDQLFDGTRATVLHVACHGVHEERAPLLSQLLFTDRQVFAFEIALAVFESDIAIIAGCQTASATAASGGYVQSLASAFQRGGVRTILASLWDIDDESSADLMRKFYERLTAGPKTSAVAAFCAAQRALRTQAGFENSWYWAPFVVFEDLQG